MSIKRAPSLVQYNVDTYDRPAIYPHSLPLPVSVTPLAPDLVYELPSSIFTIETNANEDFSLTLQLNMLNTDGSETPLDLTGYALEFYIRPRFNHSVIIKKLTIGAGIAVNDAAGGIVTLRLAQSVVASDLLVSKAPADHWDYFFNAIAGGGISELFRGPFVVHAGLYP